MMDYDLPFFLFHLFMYSAVYRAPKNLLQGDYDGT